MFVGHGLVAFALVALAARRVGWSRERALAVGLLAAGFGFLPDVDMLYAPVGLLAGADSLVGLAQGFWDASAVVHRSMTHSLVVGSVAAVGFAAWRSTDRARRALGSTLLVALVAVGAAESGGLGALVMGAFVAGGVLLVAGARHLDLSPSAVLAAALAGLLTHPFGDLFTGGPPALFYPLDVPVFDGYVALAGDPTLHLLGAMGVELLALWAGVVAYLHLTERRTRDAVHPWAAFGLAYAGAVLAVPAPTLDLSYPFVFGILGVGVVGCAPHVVRRGRRERLVATVVTALATVSLGALAYTASYLAVL
ncbi:metal-dependent hydrolase [Halomarina ordinaria]|uniref:Metal-dependent hydrolase n=1 Tax=Halomarina ordinaria TaxID=3033939 RepID=A0ABD5U4G2_9EURY|nr:metal-dependent hydrolase [Halomarina sp. PSRA2]